MTTQEISSFSIYIYTHTEPHYSCLSKERSKPTIMEDDVTLFYWLFVMKAKWFNQIYVLIVEQHHTIHTLCQLVDFASNIVWDICYKLKRVLLPRQGYYRMGHANAQSITKEKSKLVISSLKAKYKFLVFVFSLSINFI